ncbi:alpha/beta hydrolase [Bradyrhizobium oligotrophicum]|uniref:alpha/beta hydrolase n=1 Tax=Bradyrhizobium TaxID=374 RepID=UPI0029167809|nr:alpha/beta fold hydrolase [Bradyrhizobium sp. SZCCHNRI1029]
MVGSDLRAGFEKVAFKADDGTVLRGWHVPPQGDAPTAPIVVLHHGFSGLKESYLDKYAAAFSAAGLGALVYDPRNFGESEGRVRQEIDPMQQLADYRDAITFAMTLPRVDPRRIGAWGSSYGGGVAIQAAAIDQRIRCVAVQVSFLSGGAIWSHIPAETKAQLSQLFVGERLARAAGEPPMTMQVVAQDPATTPCILGTLDAYDWCMEAAKISPLWRNEVTVRSLELTFSFEPVAFLHRIAPRPLMLIAAEGDMLMPIEASREAFARAGEPKQFVSLPCGHFAPYVEHFERSSSAARDWFRSHLLQTREA